MKKSIQTLALFGKSGSTDVGESLVSLHAHLKARGLTVLVERGIAAELGVSADAADAETICRRADVAIVIGGDGTLLNTARHLAGYDVPMVGINQGRLGFMTDISRTDMPDSIDRLLAGEFTADRRMLLDACVVRDGKTIFNALALNDVVVSKGDQGRMIELEVGVDGESLHVLRADGMIISTPTGSTAYALSANGPILQPAVPGIALVPLCPHGLTHRPVTVSDTCVIEMRLVAPHDARVHCDGQSHFDACAGDIVRVTRSVHGVTLLHPPGYSYFAMLREKLHWSAAPKR
jgi:NAD+ kinase